VQVYFDNLLGCRELVARGEAVPLAISARGRNHLLPDVPTLAECGYPQHALDIWFGVFGANLGAANADAIGSVRTRPALATALAAVGLSGEVADGPSLAREIDSSLDGWRRALRSAR
jgi:tripartite-type tricarboxylate transporter receptor subunit TctC